MPKYRTDLTAEEVRLVLTLLQLDFDKGEMDNQ